MRTQLLQRSRLGHAASILVGKRRFLVLCAALGLGVSIGVAGSPFGVPESSSGLARRDSGASPFAGSLRAFHHASRPCSRAPSRRRYVAPAGRDSNPGTIKRPWATIARALGAARPGDATYLRAGSYGDWAVTSRNGAARAPISLRAYPGERPVVTGRLKIASTYFCVTGIRFVGRTPANATSVLIYVSGAHHVEIFKNEILNAFMSGIYVGDPGKPSVDVQILSNWFHDNGSHWNLDHGIYFGSGRYGLIANNVVDDNYAYGIKVAPDADYTIVTQNTVAGNHRSGIIVSGDDVSISSYNLIVNNIVASNTDWGIRTWSELGIYVGAGNQAMRNVLYGNGQGPVWIENGVGLTVSESILADPRFADWLGRNYHLQAGSSASDAARPEDSLRVDYGGVTRPTGQGPELGAFEQQ